MHPPRTKKSRNLSRQREIRQPLGTKKSRNLLGRKKNMQPLGIPQPLGTKRIMQPLGTKNHATSRDTKIITRPLGQKKIMQPLGTTKIMLSIGPVASKLVHNAPNCFKWHQICPNGSK